MNRTTIFELTPRGKREAEAHEELPPELAEILKAIDGKSTVEDLRSKLEHLSAIELNLGLDALIGCDFVHDVAVPLPQIDERERIAQELRDKIRDRRHGEDRSRTTLAINAWRATRANAEDAPKRAVADRGVQETEEKVRRELEDKVRREVEAKVRREAEEQARREAAERARQQAEEQARREAEEVARREAETVAEREAAELARQRAEAQARLMAEEKAWHAAEEKARREEQEAAERELGRLDAEVRRGTGRSGRPHSLGVMVAMGVGFLLVVGLVAIHLISFGGQIPQFETAIGAQFQQPVKIKALHFALLPRPHVRLDDVSIGSQGQIKVARIKAAGDLGKLFSEKKAFKSLELDSPVLSDEGLGWVLFGERQARDMSLGQVSAVNARIESPHLRLPPFDAKIQPEADGAWKAIVIATGDKSLAVELTAKGKAVQIDARASTFKLPFGAGLSLDDFVAAGMVDRSGLALSEFQGFALGGTLSGNARLQWGENWNLSGEVSVRQIDTAQLFPELMDSARVEGKAIYLMQAPEAEKLFSSARMEGSFAIPRGTLRGVDLGSVLQGGSLRGDTKFSDLAGSFVYERGATQLRQLRLNQNNMSAGASADIDAQKNVRGRLAAEIRLSTELRRATLAVSGNLNKLEWQRQ